MDRGGRTRHLERLSAGIGEPAFFENNEVELRALRVLATCTLGTARQTSSVLAVLVAASLGTALTAIWLGLTVDSIYFWGLLPVLPSGMAGVWTYRRVLVQRMLDRLREAWGREQDRRRIPSLVEALHRYCQASEGPDDTSVDDQTWNDLNMNTVYGKIDRTLTNPGECVLYRMLRTPLLSTETLRQRNEIIRLFQDDAAIREKVQLELRRLGRWDTNVITALVWGPASAGTSRSALYPLLASLAVVAAVGGPLLWGTRGIAAIVLVYVVNLVATYRVRTRLTFEIAAMRYQGAMILTAGRIARLPCPALASYADRLKQAGAATHSIARRTFLLLPESSFGSDLVTLVYAHLDIYFLRNVRIYHSVMREIDRHRDALQAIYSLLGELDALQSVASYREGLPAYVEPAFIEEGTPLQIEDATHPLLKNPVPNSLTIRTGGVTITGSNMAGKTTFLRTLGVNVLLAQTICTCLASSYAGGLFRIFSLINDADDLLEGKSYYLVQAEHLLKMIRSSEQPGRTLCLIDEPLAGTNSSERTAASLEILRYLADRGATVILATHDLELARELPTDFKNYYFAGHVTGEGLEFDFRLREGITPTRNALDLLRYLGFPEIVVERAARQVP
jgi:hypothetical protein